MTTIHESSINIIGESVRIEGKITFSDMTRLHGVISGEINAKDGSTLIVAETGMIQGKLHGDTILIDGFVEGDIFARTHVLISSTGRVVGNIHSPSLKMEFGAYFEGKTSMDSSLTSGRSLKPA